MRPRIVFRKLPPDLLGTCNYRKGVITIDLSKDVRNYGMVYLHELIHWRHPEFDEDEVTAKAWFGWKNMTASQRLKLLRQLFRRR